MTDFRLATPEELANAKQDRYTVRIAKAIMKVIPELQAESKSIIRKYEPNFGVHVLNADYSSYMKWHVGCRRVESYNFDQFWTKPHKSPIYEAFMDLLDEVDGTEACAFVFKHVDLGDMVLFDGNVQELPFSCLRLPIDYLTIARFKDFLTMWKD